MKRNKSKGSERDLGCQVYFEGRARKTVQSKQPVAADTANERERERERECVCVCVYIYIPSHKLGFPRKDGLSTVSDL